MRCIYIFIFTPDTMYHNYFDASRGYGYYPERPRVRDHFKAKRLYYIIRIIVKRYYYHRWRCCWRS